MDETKTPETTPPTVVLETKEEQQARAELCMAEIKAVLEKHKCEISMSYHTHSNGATNFAFNVETEPLTKG